MGAGYYGPPTLDCFFNAGQGMYVTMEYANYFEGDQVNCTVTFELNKSMPSLSVNAHLVGFEYVYWTRVKKSKDSHSRQYIPITDTMQS